MHARVTTIQEPPGSVDETIRNLNEEILPKAREIPGFKGIFTLVDRTSGKSITATLWESEDAMKASEEAANRLRDQAAQAGEGAEVVSVERFEVAVDERAG